MACQFNSSELAPLDDLGHYIQDALDLIEFANGSPRRLGRKRAAMGHPAFNLKMIGVGNEQWGRSTCEAHTTLRQGDQERTPEDHADHGLRACASDERSVICGARCAD